MEEDWVDRTFRDCDFSEMIEITKDITDRATELQKTIKEEKELM